MKTKKYFTLVISVFLILCLIFNGLLDRKNQDLQKGIDEALTLNLISIDELIDQDTEKLKVFKLYFDETKFTDYWKKIIQNTIRSFAQFMQSRNRLLHIKVMI